ncbi:MAG: efflux RND transporter periplasmic adaptor subunit [Thiohalocapsa sp.]
MQRLSEDAPAMPNETSAKRLGMTCRHFYPVRCPWAGAPMLGVGLILAVAGCERGQETPSGPSAPPTVKVAEVLSQTVSREAEFIGSTEAIRSVTLRARVQGFLKRRLFTEGATVKESDLLYVIDPSQYEADLRVAQGDLATKQAALVQVQADLARYEKLRLKKDVAEDTYDAAVAKEKETKAAAESGQAAVDQAQLNLDYTRITTPLTGRIGDTSVNVGNLVGPEQNSELATIVQLDPIYVVFRPGGADMDAIVAKQSKAPVPVTVKLSDGAAAPHTGEIDFIDNRVDPATGTLKMRAVIANPDAVLLPGRFARVQVDLGAQPDSLLVPQTALVENQGGFLLYVVGDNDKVQVRNVQVGPAQGSLRVVESGVRAGEQVIVGGLQLVKADMEVKPKPVSPAPSSGMPTSGAPAAAPVSTKPASIEPGS